MTHEWQVQTPYYTATVPIWLDEITDLEAWKSEFLKVEAKEVVEAIGAWIYCFCRTAPCDDVERNLKAIQDVVEEHVGYAAADVVMLAVAVPKSRDIVERNSEHEHVEWEDTCLEFGFEYIDYAGQGMNEFREKTGFERVKEALEACEWSGTSTGADEEHNLEIAALGSDLGDLDGVTRDEAEMTAELFGMKAALAGEDSEPEVDGFMTTTNDEASQVEDLDKMMGKLLAVKEQSAELPMEQRKRMAARAVKELMEDGKGS